MPSFTNGTLKLMSSPTLIRVVRKYEISFSFEDGIDSSHRLDLQDHRVGDNEVHALP